MGRRKSPFGTHHKYPFGIGYEWDAMLAWTQHRVDDAEIPAFEELATDYQDVLVMRAIVNDTDRQDGSHELSDGSRVWLKGGGAHREDGPALIGEMATWWLHGERYTFYDWCEKLNKSDKEKALLLLKYKI